MRAYTERLSVPPVWWLTGAVSIAILGAELWAGFGVVAAIVVYAVLFGAYGALLLRWGSARIEVTADRVTADGRSLPRDAIGEVMPLDERQTRVVRGERADPAAYMLIRPYLRCAVFVEVPGPGDTAPYWLIATRRPAELAAALRDRAAAELNPPP